MLSKNCMQCVEQYNADNGADQKQTYSALRGLELPQHIVYFGWLHLSMQDALQQEGTNPETLQPNGRFSRNLRIVKYDVKSGRSTAQYIYPLDLVDDINTRTDNDFAANAQGRNIGVSSIYPLSDTQFLVLERDNRGVGADNASPASVDVAHKRIYKIDISRATDVANIPLTNTNTLPAGVEAVTKNLVVDLVTLFKNNNAPLMEKLEGVSIGPKLEDGSHSVIVVNDNDFSVTQDADDVQSDVCITSPFAPPFPSNGTAARATVCGRCICIRKCMCVTVSVLA
eukprot:jgi/Chrzof1/3193/Cz12g15110.t1